MGSSSKTRTTMAKRSREAKLREKRMEKQARKQARKLASADQGDPTGLTDQIDQADQDDSAEPV